MSQIRTPLKQPCLRCGHGKGIHHVERTKTGIRNACGFPNCRCKNYKQV